ncbi:MAG: type II toxin-antitoxin system HicB family antitoxin [Candidatus Aminicenantes bacterium]|nr:type II toxin-antitoxin system HicB family antitoxin [Candidatus Aminicenantes bacterium]
MKDLLKHEGFIGSVHFSSEDECFFGKIEGIDDLISFEGQDVKSLKEAFVDAVTDYQAICEKSNKPLYKSYKGSFNVRIAPDLHKKAVQKSIMMGISLNQLIQKAIEEMVIPTSTE